MAALRTVLKEVALDLLLGRFDTDIGAVKSLNTVSPFIYLCGAAWALIGYLLALGTTADIPGGLFLLGFAAYTHWRRSVVSATVVLVHVLYLPFALAGRLEPADLAGSVVLYVGLLLCAYRAFCAARYYQRHSS